MVETLGEACIWIYISALIYCLRDVLGGSGFLHNGSFDVDSTRNAVAKCQILTSTKQTSKSCELFSFSPMGAECCLHQHCSLVCSSN